MKNYRKESDKIIKKIERYARSKDPKESFIGAIQDFEKLAIKEGKREVIDNIKEEVNKIDDYRGLPAASMKEQILGIIKKRRPK